MEPQYRATENALFYGVDSVGYPAASVTGISGGFPAPPGGPAVNDSVIRLNGNGPKMGPAIILKVMAGDRVMMGSYYYFNPQSSVPTAPLTAQNLVSSLVSGLATLSPIASEGSTILSSSTSSSALQAALTSVSSFDTGSLSSRPQAYMNWVSLDNQFNAVPNTGNNYQNGAMQVKTAGPIGTALQSPLGQTITVQKSGYLYIYLSNTSKGWDVFFDNLSIMHYSSPLVEENHYYPFGLGMAGISDEAIKTQYAENKYRFNKGSELQNKEFADGSGLEMYETNLRMLDPQLGRWWQIDSKTDQSYESVSPYSAMNNDPIRFNDVNGDEGESCCSLTFTWENVKASFNQDVQNVKDVISTAGDNFKKRWEAGVTLPQEFVRNPLSAVTSIEGISFPTEFEVNTTEPIPAPEGSNYTPREIPEPFNTSSEQTATVTSGSTVSSEPLSLESAPKSKLGPGLGNQFKNSTVEQTKDAFDVHVKSGKLSLKYTNPNSGAQAYVNNESGYSYNIDPGGTYGKKVEGPHIDVNYSKPKPNNVPSKKKLPLSTN